MNSSEETILSLDFETIRDQWQAVGEAHDQ